MAKTNSIEAQAYFWGSIALLGAMLATVVDTQLNQHNLLQVGIVTCCLVLVRNKSARLPFLLLAVHYVVANMLGGFYLQQHISLPPTYSHLFTYDRSITWEAVHLACIAFGVFFVSIKTSKVDKTNIWFVPQPKNLVLFLFWASALIFVLVYPAYKESRLVRIVTYNIIPTTAIAIMLYRPRFSKFVTVTLLSILPSFIMGWRHIAVQFLATCFMAFSFQLRNIKMPRLTFFMIGLLISCALASIFWFGTYTKYGYWPENHFFNRIMLVQAHSSMKIKEAVDSNSFREHMDVPWYEYWGSLIPLIKKPYISGHLTYRVSRLSGVRTWDPAYLPPSSMAEFYLSGGWPMLLFGGLFNGALLGWIWNLAIHFRRSSLPYAFCCLAVVYLCGIGAISFYGRLMEIKMVAYLMLLFWGGAVLSHKGFILSAIAPESPEAPQPLRDKNLP